MSEEVTVQDVFTSDSEKYEQYTLNENTELGKVRHEFSKGMEEIIAVRDDERVVGVVPVNHVFWKTQDNTKLNTLVESAEIIRHVPQLKPEESILDVANKFIQTQATILPVVNEYEKLIGIVKDFDAVETLMKKAPVESVKVGDLYLAPDKTITFNTTIAQIMETYKRSKIRELPIIEDGMLKGSVNINTIVKDWFGGKEGSEYYAWLRKDKDYGVRDAIDAATVGESAITLKLEEKPTVIDAFDMMKRKAVRTVFVIEKGEFRGILNIEELLRYLIDVIRVQTPLLNLHINNSPNSDFNEHVIRKTRDIVNKYYGRLRNIGKDVDGYIDFKEIHKAQDQGSQVSRWEINARIAFSKSNIFTVSTKGYKYDVAANDALDKLDRVLGNEVEKITDKTKYTSARKLDRELDIEEELETA